MNNEQARKFRIKAYIIILVLLAIGMINSIVKGDMYSYMIDEENDNTDISGAYHNITVYDKHETMMFLEDINIIVNNSTITGTCKGYYVIREKMWGNVEGDIVRGSYRNGKIKFSIKFIEPLKVRDFRFDGGIDKDGLISGVMSGDFRGGNSYRFISWQSKTNDSTWYMDIKMREVGGNKNRAQPNGSVYITLSNGTELQHFQISGVIIKDRNEVFWASQANDRAILTLTNQTRDRLVVKMERDTIVSITGKIGGKTINSRKEYKPYNVVVIDKPFMQIYSGDDPYNTYVRETLQYVDKYYGGFYH